MTYGIKFAFYLLKVLQYVIDLALDDIAIARAECIVQLVVSCFIITTQNLKLDFPQQIYLHRLKSLSLHGFKLLSKISVAM